MRATAYRWPDRVWDEKDRPAIEHPNEAVVRVVLAAIRGSDLQHCLGLVPDTRVRPDRAKVVHHMLDPVVVLGPWVPSAAATVVRVRRFAETRRRR